VNTLARTDAAENGPVTYFTAFTVTTG
jgi:hypothetical protein